MGLLEKATVGGAMLFNVAAAHASVGQAPHAPQSQQHGKYQVIQGPAHEKCTIAKTPDGEIVGVNIRDFRKNPTIGVERYIMDDTKPIQGGVKGSAVEILPNDEERETDLEFETQQKDCVLIDHVNKLMIKHQLHSISTVGLH
jgi:hypothetical protein